MKHKYENPLSARYSSDEMQYIFSPDFKFSTWRKLWCALAEAEKELGLGITNEQIEQMKSHIYDIDYEKASQYEQKLRHDVMAHVHTYGDVCPDAKPIIHLGATSCYVGDNTDIIQMKSALLQIKKLLINAIKHLSDFAQSLTERCGELETHWQRTCFL